MTLFPSADSHPPAAEPHKELIVQFLIIVLFVALQCTIRSVLLFACAASVLVAQQAATSVVISQVYGGGGNSGASYRNDFVELFNSGNSPVDISGWTVQYASANGISWDRTMLHGTIKPGQYYLVGEAQGSGGSVALPTVNALSTSWDMVRPTLLAAILRRV